MGILDKLRPQPEWKHTDPAVRVAAVQQLADEAADDLLATLAREDADARVRRAAVERLTDSRVLTAVLRDDASDEVRAAAAAVLVNAVRDSQDEAAASTALEGLVDPRDLAEVAKTAVLEAVGHAALSRVRESKGLDAIARRSIHSTVRLEALRRMDEATELASVALKSEHKDVAMVALERLADDDLYDHDTIAAIATRARNKIVARRAKSVLRAREDAPPPPTAEELHEQGAALCRQVEALAQTDELHTVSDQLREIDVAWNAWRAAAGESAAESMIQRFGEAVETARARLAAHEQAQVEQRTRQAALAEATAAQRALCERVEQAEPEEAAQEVDAAYAAWSALPSEDDEVLASAEMEALQQRFEQSCEAARQRHVQWIDVKAWRQRVAVSLDIVEAHVESDAVADLKRRWTAARSEWSAIPDGWTDELRTRVDAIDARLRVRKADAREDEARQRRANLARLTQRCEQLEALAASDALTLKQAERGFRDVRTLLEGHDPVPTKRDHESLATRLKRSQQALYPRLHELREIDAWRQWANVKVQEDLCRRVEALNQVEDPEEVARQLRDCVTEWKGAAVVPRERAAELWHRFKTAHDQAYARCAAFYAAQAEDRKQNLKRKETLCEQAEALAASTDWLKMASKIVQLQAEWKAAGPVPRRHAQTLWKRFRGACDQFFSRRKADLAQRKEAWAANLERKEALCVQAEALADSEDFAAATAELGRLQAEWRKVGPVKKSRCEAIWQRFRAAGDRLAECHAEREELALADKVAGQEALCAELEALLPSGDAETSAPDGLSQQVQAVRQRWQEASAVRHRRSQAIASRFQEAVRRLVEVYPDGFKGTDLDPYKNRRRMEQLCDRVERLLPDAEQGSESGVSPAELLAWKWREKMAANTMGVHEDEGARRRAAAEEVKRAQSEWKRLTPPAGDAGRELAARFQRACDRFVTQTKRPSSKSRQAGQSSDAGRQLTVK